MTWEEARELSIQKWTDVLEMVRRGEPLRDLMERVAEACGFCLKAKELQEQAGDRKPVQCPFCHLYIEYGGCRTPLDEIQELLVNERWEEAEEWLLQLLEKLRIVPLPAD